MNNLLFHNGIIKRWKNKNKKHFVLAKDGNIVSNVRSFLMDLLWSFHIFVIKIACVSTIVNFIKSFIKK